MDWKQVTWENMFFNYELNFSWVNKMILLR